MTPELREAFHQFARNGRWGTCAHCPTVTDFGKVPELCGNTERYDHQLDIDLLLSAYRRDH